MAPTLANPARPLTIRTASAASVSNSVQPSLSRRAVPARSPAQRTNVEVGNCAKSASPQYLNDDEPCKLVSAPEPAVQEQDAAISTSSSALAAIAEETPSSSPRAQLANNIVPLPSSPSSSSTAAAAEAATAAEIITLPTALSTSTIGGTAPSTAPSISTSMCGRDHNSVTIKANTNVKDAAGAVVKVLNRIPNVLVTALRLEACHESLNRAVKSIAVARKYINDMEVGSELSFLPFNRSNAEGALDPNLFAFLCFKTQLAAGLKLLEQDQTDLNVSRGSNANTMANAIIRIIKERGQAVMKAGGCDAIFIAMSAMVNARRRLKRNHNMDAMIVPAWITEDTSSTLGRESKFLRFNILPCAVNGPFDSAPLSIA